MPFEIFDSSADDDLDRPLTRDEEENERLLADEANWPEEFSMLASQLSADAARLAAIYPARGDSQYPARPDLRPNTAEPAVAATWSPAALLPSVRGARWIAAAAVLALASLATLSTHPSFNAGVVDEPNATPAVQLAVNGDANAPAPQGGAKLLEETQLFEETGFENLSSPAQEALLDLFEDDQLAQASLSI